jgi:hypothetical protein
MVVQTEFGVVVYCWILLYAQSPRHWIILNRKYISKHKIIQHAGITRGCSILVYDTNEWRNFLVILVQWEQRHLFTLVPLENNGHLCVDVWDHVACFVSGHPLTGLTLKKIVLTILHPQTFNNSFHANNFIEKAYHSGDLFSSVVRSIFCWYAPSRTHAFCDTKSNRITAESIPIARLLRCT